MDGYRRELWRFMAEWPPIRHDPVSGRFSLSLSLSCSLTDMFFSSFSFLGTDRQIPTTLSYVDGDEYYGTQAKAFLVRNPTNTVAYFKDFLGQEYVMPTTYTFY